MNFRRLHFEFEMIENVLEKSLILGSVARGENEVFPCEIWENGTYGFVKLNVGKNAINFNELSYVRLRSGACVEE